MRSTRNSISAILLLVVAAWPGQAPAIVEAVSKAITPSETTPVFRGMWGTSKSETLPPTYMDVSALGRYVLYRSMATDILPGFVDEPGGDDLFLFDRVLRQTTLVTHHPGSSEPINKGAAGQMSEDGSTVLFSADESNGTAAPSVYMFDRASGNTRFIGRTPYVPPGPLSWAVSADGSWSAIVISDSAGVDRNLFLYERASAALHPVPNPPGCLMQAPEISVDGLTVLFERQCPGGEPGVYEVVLYERLSGVETVVRTEAIKGALSRDGRFVLFGSHRSDVLPGLVDPNGSRPDLYRYDKLTQETILVNRGASPLTTWTGPGVDVRSARISDDGSVVALTMDSSGATEPFVFKASTGAVERRRHSPLRFPCSARALP